MAASVHEPISDDQVENNAKAKVWAVTDETRLKRFLCMGTEGGTYQTEELDLTIENCNALLTLIDSQQGPSAVNIIKEFSHENHAAKQDAIIFALAFCAHQKDVKTRQAAYAVLSDVCRTSTHLFSFIDLAERLSTQPNSGDGPPKSSTGWGRAQRRAIAKWYNDKPGMDLAMAVTKYIQRKGWSHKDVLCLAHVKPNNNETGAVLKYVVHGLEKAKTEFLTDESTDDIKEIIKYLDAVHTIKHTKDKTQAALLISQFSLNWEHVPTELLTSKEVWTALINTKCMAMTALLRNITRLAGLELLEVMSDTSKCVIERLADTEALIKARIHPLSVLLALKQYEARSTDKTHKKKVVKTWTVNPNISEALDRAFYSSFKSLEPTKKRYLLAISVSGSEQGSKVKGVWHVTSPVVAATMAMTIARMESQYHIVLFSDEVEEVKLSSLMTLNEVCQAVNKKVGSEQGTDCSCPITWANEYKMPVDVFVLFTDSEVTSGSHPAEALRKYRQDMDIWDARLVVCGMSSNKFTIADPEDPGMLDVIGFDTHTPGIIHDFALGIL